jgi:hypothetical protein
VTAPDTETADQRAALAFLDGRVRNGKATRIDTHISIVFLEADRVLKIKRAVRLPFLDFSTLAKRKHACEEELAVNRRYAPAIYRRVVPITRGSNGVEIDGKGPVIEWAVEMARFDERKALDHLARSGQITPALGETLADVLRDSHQHAERSDGATWLRSIVKIIDRNTTKFHAETMLARETVERLDRLSHQRLAETMSLLQQRAVNGLVRRCHGDAHLGNIVLIEDKPVLFDAIEFDPAIATTDILYDLAFPLMDLVHFGLNDAANRLLNRYIETSWDDCADALRLLPLFLSIRAAIRAYVLFTRSEQGHDDAESAGSARSYFELALRHLEPAQPSLIAIGGKSGTGKSVLARDIAARIAPPPGAVILRSDVIRKQLFGVDPQVNLPKPAYTPEVTARVYRTLSERARRIVADGFSVIIDAAFLHQAERDELDREARGTEADFQPLFLDAPLAIRLARIGSRKNDASDATADVAAQQEDYDLGRLDWPAVDASGSPAETLQRSLAHLLPRQRLPDRP